MKRIPLLSFFGLAKELLYLQSYIRINDNSSAIIENCKQISECTDICVILLTGSFRIELWGYGLTVNSFSQKTVEVRGRIDEVKLVSRMIKERE